MTTHASNTNVINDIDPIMLGQMRQIANQIRSGHFRRSSSDQFFQDRDIEDEAGWPKEHTKDEYRQMFDRFGIARRVVELFPIECWKKQPKIVEDDDGENITAFESAWAGINDNLLGQSWHRESDIGKASPIWQEMKRADIASRIGSFGILLIGFDDGKDLREPVDGIDPDTGLSSIAKPIDREAIRQKEKESLLSDMSDEEFASLEGIADEPLNDEEINDESRQESTDQSIEREEITEISENPEEEEEKSDVELEEIKDEEFQELARGDGPELKDESLTIDEIGFENDAVEEIVESFEPKIKILYLRSFDQSLVEIDEWETEPSSPRFGLPKMYNITFSDPRAARDGEQTVGMPNITGKVHWTRVIHLAENRLSSPVFSTPVMKGGYHHLLDLIKLFASSGEGYFQGAFPGTYFETHPQLGGDVLVDVESLQDQYQRSRKGFERAMFLAGMTSKQHTPTVVDPSPQVATNIQALCIGEGYPVTVFVGDRQSAFSSSAGGSDNERIWDERVEERQVNYLSTQVIFPFVNRLIMVGALPTPESGFSVKWPNVSNKTIEQRANAVDLLVKAIASYVQSGADSIIHPMDLLTQDIFLGLDDKLAKEILDRAKEGMADEEDEDPFGDNEEEVFPLSEDELEDEDVLDIPENSEKQTASEEKMVSVKELEPFAASSPPPPLPPSPEEKAKAVEDRMKKKL